MKKTIKLPILNNLKKDVIEDISDETTKLTRNRLINEKACVSCKRPWKKKGTKLPSKKIRINITSTIPEVDAKIDRCNLSMNLPKNIVCI